MKKLGGYVELELLGRGQWTGVYRARRRKSGREYALKIFGTLEPSRRETLNRAVAKASLAHPQILKLHGLETDEAGGCCFLVMEYAANGSLRHRLAKGALEAEPALELALQIAGGLEAAHARGLCHLNLKPENILFTEPGRVKLGDLGLSSCKEEPALDEMLRGAPGYSAPEQIEGSAGPASDVYALGAILLEMLTGRAPAARALDENNVPPIDVRGRLREAGLKNYADLAALLERFLAPLPEDRPGHGGQAAALLELLIAGRGPAAFNRTMESTNRCEVCRKPIPLSRSLCPICAGRSGVHAAEGQGLPHEPGDSGRVSHRFRSAGIGVAMFLLLAVGAFAWRGGSAWRTADQPAVAEAPAKNLAASLPRGVAILGAAASGNQQGPGGEKGALGGDASLVARASAGGNKAAQPGAELGGLRSGVKEALYTSAAKAGSLGKAVRAELERSPQSLGARRNLALLLMQKGSYDKAARLLKGILKENPADKEARSTLEMIAILNGRG